MERSGGGWDPAGYARVGEVERSVPASPERVLRLVRALGRLPEWLELHGGWRGEAPGVAVPGLRFVQQVGLMGIPADVTWTVVAADGGTVALTGEGPMGLVLALEFSAAPAGPGGGAAAGDAALVRCRAGFGGDPVAGPIGASLTRAVEDALAASLDRLAERLAADAGSPAATDAGPVPVLHRASGVMLDPRTPVLVGAGQVVRRVADAGESAGDPPHPASLGA
jgi:acetyl-CoA C-acetyltransferase